MRFIAGLGRFLVTAVVVVVAVIVGRQVWVYYVDAPWTRDGRVSADVVGVTPDVAGPVVEVLVHDEQLVHKGDVLFRIDPARFRIAELQAEAALAARKSDLDQATREYNRYRQLNQLSTSLEKQEQMQAALQLAAANYQAAQVNQSLAQLNLDRTEVRASVNGSISNMTLRPGDYVSSGKGVFALVDTDTIRVDGYFEETKLGQVGVGDKVTVQLMGMKTTLHGHVQSIASGIADREQTSSSDLLANVNPTFSWVRLAQRVPVRVKLEDAPADDALLVGRTATVVVEKGTRHAALNLLAWD